MAPGVQPEHDATARCGRQDSQGEFTIMLRRVLAACAIVLISAQLATAQGQQTGTLQGSVTDSSGLALPGVTVTVTSPALQGPRTTVSGGTGDYVLHGLPPGAYRVRFELDGFSTSERTVTVDLGLPAQSDVQLAPAGVTEAIVVVGETAPALVSTSGSANYTEREIDSLATGRTVADIAKLAPGLTGNTPNADQVTISGAFAYDNVFLLDGVDISENLFGSPDDLFIEDAIEQTQVLTSGVSAEYGRFSGGVINAITKSGGNTLSGSFRVDFTNPSWRDENPLEDEGGTTRDSHLGKVFQGTVGGPILLDRLWYFGAGRWENVTDSRPLPQTGVQFDREDKDRRFEVKLTGTLAPNHTLQGSYFRNRLEQHRPTFAFTIDPTIGIDSRSPADRIVTTYRGTLRSNLFAEAQFSRKKLGFRDRGGSSTNIVDSPMITRTQEQGHYNAPYFDSTDPEDRDNRQFTGSVSWFLGTTKTGSHDFKAGAEHFTATNTTGNSQSATNYVFIADYLTDVEGNPLFDGQGKLQPVFVPGLTLVQNWIPVRGATMDIGTTSLYFQDRWTPSRNWALDLGVRYERVRSDATGGTISVDTDTIVPRFGATFDPLGDGQWILQATYAHYAGKYSEAQFSQNTNVGNPSITLGLYTGPRGTGRGFAPGFDVNNYLIVDGLFPTANAAFEDGLSSPTTKEFTASVGRQFGRGYLKGSYIVRNVSGFVEDFIDLSTGDTDVVFQGVDFGTFSNRLFTNSDDPERRYHGLAFQSRYRLSDRWNAYGNWTVQLVNEGNFEGEAQNQPAISSPIGDFPEAFNEERHFPVGRLAGFQRHKVRMWTTYLVNVGRAGSVDLGLLYRYDSPTPYSLVAEVGLTDIQNDLLAAYASNPGDQDLFFGGRGTELFDHGSHLFDLGVTYSLPIFRSLRPYLKADIRNIFNRTPLIGFDTTVDPNFDGPLDDLGLPTTFVPGPRFGQATENDDYPLPREFRFALGFRF